MFWMVNKLLSGILIVSLLLEIVVMERMWYTKYHVQANALSLLYLMWDGGCVGKHRVVYHLRMGEEHGRSVGTKGELVWIVRVKRVILAGGSGPFRNGFAKIIMSWRHYTWVRPWLRTVNVAKDV
jgi:hypothetical protein